jgi:hypothetical protein
MTEDMMKITRRQLRKIIKEVVTPALTDPQEIADIIYSAIEIGEKGDYSRFLQFANREAGSDVSVYVEPALQMLVDDGIFQRTPDNFYMRMM